METLKSPKAIALVMTILFFCSMAWILNTQHVTSVLEDDLDGEKLKSESMLSEKLLLQKDIDRLKTQLASSTGKNEQLDKIVAMTSAQLAAQQLAYQKLSRNQASLQQIKNHRDELLRLMKGMEDQVTSLNQTIATLRQENQNMNATVASLQQRNSLLNDELKKAMLAHVDFTEVQSLKGAKLTIKARQSKKLIATFEVPSELKNLSYKIIAPTGKVIPASEGTISSRVLGDGSAYVASSQAQVVSSDRAKVEMIYQPGTRLKAGTYKIEILNDNLYVGSLQVKLK